MNGKKYRIVTIGGGSGQFALLSGLRDIEKLDITAVVSMVDSGGSTGRLRDEMGVLPPGDILKCILALSPEREMARKMLQKRFASKNRLNGHNAGNMLLTILSQYAGSFPDGVSALADVLEARGKILPVTTNKATLVAELTDGSHLYGEAAIDVPTDGRRAKIKKAFLVPHHNDRIAVHPPVIKAIEQADYIVIGPGDLYTSIVPNFLIGGVKEAIKKSRAKKIYVVNIMTKFGETHGFRSIDFVHEIEDYIDTKLNYVVINSQDAPVRVAKKYEQQKSVPVEYEKGELGRRKVVYKDIMDSAGGIIRHDSDKLANIIKGIVGGKY